MFTTCLETNLLLIIIQFMVNVFERWPWRLRNINERAHIYIYMFIYKLSSYLSLSIYIYIYIYTLFFIGGVVVSRSFNNLSVEVWCGTIRTLRGHKLAPLKCVSPELAQRASSGDTCRCCWVGEDNMFE